MTPNLSFSACLAENPGALKIENPEFSAQNARSYPYPARLAPLHKIAPIRLFAQDDQAYSADFAFDRRLKRLKTKPVRGNATFNQRALGLRPGALAIFRDNSSTFARGSVSQKTFRAIGNRSDTHSSRIVGRRLHRTHSLRETAKP